MNRIESEKVITMYQPGNRPRMTDAISAPAYQSAYMARMNERIVPSQRPHTTNTTTNEAPAGSYYESSYLRKKNENPAHSVSKSYSYSSSKRDIQPTRTNETARIQNDVGIRMRPSTVHTHEQYAPPPSISENHSYGFPSLSKMPLSPAETMNAILMEETNSPRALSPPRTGGSFNYSPFGRREHESPSPERLSSPPRTRMNASDENFGNHIRQSSPPRTSMNASDENFGNIFNRSMSIHDRSPSPKSRKMYNTSYSASPDRQRQPLTATYKSNVPDYHGYTASSKLPHEQRQSSPVDKRRYKGPESHDVPFWTRVSVKVSSALLNAGKDKKYAEAAQIAVVQAGADQYETDQEALNYVSSKASLAVMHAGGDANTAAIATVACIQANDETPNTEEKFKNEVDRVMSDMKNTASAVSKATIDGGTKAVNAISVFASRGFEDLKSFSQTSYRNYRVYQRNYLKERNKTLRKLTSSRDHGDRRRRSSRRESRYDSDSDEDRRRGKSGRRTKDDVDSRSGSGSSSSYSSTSYSSESSKERTSGRRNKTDTRGRRRNGRHRKSMSSSSSR